MPRSLRRPLITPLVILTLLVILCCATLTHAQEVSEPIPDPNRAADQQVYLGAPADAMPIASLPIPTHPGMQAGEGSNIHNDGYMSDTYTHAGPLGVNPQVSSVSLGGICATLTFDSAGRLITTCLNLNEANLFVLRADTLAVLDSLALPYREVSLADLEFPAGSYFFLDADGQAVIPVVGNAIWIVGVTAEDQLEQRRVIDLNAYLPEGDEVNSILPGVDRLLWFTTLGGIVGTLDSATEQVQTRALEGERISNSFAVDEANAAYIVSDTALYRFDHDAANQPVVTWREPYDRGTQIKPGQVSQGSGTTPTLMGENYVAIADNAEPQMQVLVYQRGVDAPLAGRLLCAVPVFTPGRSATENSLIATDRSIIVENNYGYVPAQLLNRDATEAGISRIDIADDGTCNTVWTSQEAVPSAVSKLSLTTGAIYTYTRVLGGLTGASWFFTAIDFATGATLWKQYTGTGLNFNNNYAAVYLGQDGTGYVGVTRGIVAVRDLP